jgi:hypothetical protein
LKAVNALFLAPSRATPRARMTRGGHPGAFSLTV